MKGYIGVKRVVDGKANDVPTVIHRQVIDHRHNAVSIIVLIEKHVVVEDKKAGRCGHLYRELAVSLDIFVFVGGVDIH